MSDEKVIEFAKEKGYDSAEYLKDWNGYKCYEPYFEGDDVACVGLPLVILVKGNEIRMSTAEEAMEI